MGLGGDSCPRVGLAKHLLSAEGVVPHGAGFQAKHLPGLSFGGVLALMVLQFAVVALTGLAFYLGVERPFMTPHWPKRLFGWLRNVDAGRFAVERVGRAARV